MTRHSPFTRVVRRSRATNQDKISITVQTFWAALDQDALQDVHDVEIRYMRTLSDIHPDLVREYRVTIRGDENRCRIVENVITQTLRGNTKGRRALVHLANRLR